MVIFNKKFLLSSLLALGLLAQPMQTHAAAQSFDPSQTASYIMGEAVTNGLSSRKKLCIKIITILEEIKTALQANTNPFGALTKLSNTHPTLAEELQTKTTNEEKIAFINTALEKFGIGQKQMENKLSVSEQIYTLFAQNDRETLSPLFDFNAYSEELEIISKNGKKSLLTILNKHTRLSLGEFKLAKTLGQPTDNDTELRRRQAVLRELVENNVLRQQIVTYLDEVKKIELDILSFWNGALTSHLLSSGPFIGGSHSLSSTVNVLKKIPGLKTSLNNADKQPWTLGVFGVLLARIQVGFVTSGVDTVWSFAKNGVETLAQIPELVSQELVPYVGSITVSTIPLIMHKLLTTVKGNAYLERELNVWLGKNRDIRSTNITTDSVLGVSKKITFSNKTIAQNALSRFANNERLFSKPDADNENSIIVSYRPEVAEEVCSLINPRWDNALKLTAFILFLGYFAPIAPDLFGSVALEALALPTSWTTMIGSFLSSAPIAIAWASSEVLNNLASGLYGLVKSTIFGKMYLTDPLQEGLVTQVDMVEKAYDLNKKLAFFVKKTKALKAVLEHNTVLHNNLTCLKHLDAQRSIVTPTTPGDLSTLLKTLNTADITGAIEPLATPSWYSPRRYNPWRIIKGRTVGVADAANYKVMTEHKNSFSHLLEAVGELDMWVGLAELYKEHETDQRHCFCFTSFVSPSTGPTVYDPAASLGTARGYLRAHNLWYPYLLNRMKKQEISPYEYLELGGPNHQKTALMYGANAKGKSTLLRAIANATILSLCFGIAPAQNFTIMPPSKLLVSIVSKDNPAQGLSGFTSHLDKLRNIITQAATLKAQNKHALVIIDELCQASTALAGELASKKMLEQNFANPDNNALSFITVHKESPAELINTMPNDFKFYGFMENRSIKTLTTLDQIRELLQSANVESLGKAFAYGLIK
ncbi:hypothetical protein K2X40_01555 [Candidatus Babeliales bacterium]|nr:hypothetical protein [Candidatus Babeliales bacterium]